MLSRIVSSSPCCVAESTRARDACSRWAASASTSEPSRRFAPTSPMICVCCWVNWLMFSAMPVKSRMASCSSNTACESSTDWMREEIVVMSDAIRLAWAVSWPMSGRVAPGQTPSPAASASSSCRRTLGSSGGSSSPTTAACHSPNNDREAAITAGRGGTAAPSYTCRSASTQSPSASRMVCTRPTRTPRSTTGFPTPSPPTVRNRAVNTSARTASCDCDSHSAPNTMAASDARMVAPTRTSSRRLTGAPPRSRRRRRWRLPADLR